METVLVKSKYLNNRSRPDSSIYVAGDTPEILTRIYETQIKLCIYKRVMDTHVKEYAFFLLNTFNDFQITQTVSLHKLNDLLNVSLPQHQYRQSFIKDLYTVADMYACLFERHQVGFRLCVLNKAMCPRFHTDKVPCRLITTYSGKGTEWLDYLESESDFLETLNQKPENLVAVQKLNSGDIALFKGDKWDGRECSGVIHRSPDPGSDKKRLLLSLDIIH